MSRDLPLPPGWKSDPLFSLSFDEVAPTREQIEQEFIDDSVRRSEPTPLDEEILLQEAYGSGYDAGYLDGYKAGHGDTL